MNKREIISSNYKNVRENIVPLELVSALRNVLSLFILVHFKTSQDLTMINQQPKWRISY
jgi:hypothetical protein